MTQRNGLEWPNKTALRRLLEIDRLVRAGGLPTVEKLARRFEVAERTVYRDLAYLRDQLGAPLAYRRTDGGGGYYYTDPNYVLPANFIRHGEMVGLLLAGKLVEQTAGQPRGPALAGLLGRLRQLLTENELLIVEAEVAAFDYAARRTRRVDAAVVEAAARSLRRRRRVALDLYEPATGGWRALEFETYHVVHLNTAWHLLGLEVGADERAALPLARVKGLRETDERYTIPRDFDLDAALADAFGFRLGAPEYRVALEFRGEAARLVAEREWHPSQRLSFRADGSVVLTLRTAHLEELARWLAGFGGDARVQSPPELRELVLRRARELIAVNENRHEPRRD